MSIIDELRKAIIDGCDEINAPHSLADYLLDGCVPINLNVSPDCHIVPIAFEYAKEIIDHPEHVYQWPYDTVLLHGAFFTTNDQPTAILVNAPGCYDKNYKVGFTLYERLKVGSWVSTVSAGVKHNGDLYVSPAKRIKGLDDNITLEELSIRFHEVGIDALRFVIAAYGILNMKQFVKSTNQPSERIQAKRKKRGQAPLPTTIHISLDPRVVSAYLGGTHASPRPHWRRGHIRTMTNGKLVRVQPHMVMGEAPLPKQIIVEG